MQKTLALLHRALRTDVRLLRTHVFRGGLIGVILLLLWNAHDQTWAGSPGLEFFSWLQFWNFWFITFAGATFFATPISEEKEELTLGLLRIAGIGALTLLLGKWLPRVIGALLLLTVQFPFTLLAITLGGILLDQALAAYCALAAHLLLVSTIGLLASVIAARSTGASVLAGVLLLLWLASPIFIELLGAALAALWIIPDGMRQSFAVVGEDAARLTAMYRLDEILQTGFDQPPLGRQVIANTAAALLLFVGAWLLFDVCTRNETAAHEGARWTGRLMRMGRRGSRRSWDAALLWKDFYGVAGGPRMTLLKLPVYGLLLVVTFLAFFTGRTLDWGDLKYIGAFTMVSALLVLLFEMALIAGRTFRQETMSGTWPSLMMLPKSLPETAYAKLLGAALGLAPVIGFLLAGAVLSPEAVSDFFEYMVFDDEGFFVLVFVLLQVLLFLHVTVLLSVTWSWGSWPVSIFFAGFFVIMGNILVFACIETGPMLGSGVAPVMFVLSFVTSSLILAVHVWIGLRLSALAGE